MAFGTAAPWGSVTRPPNAARSSWVRARGAAQRQKTAESANINMQRTVVFWRTNWSESVGMGTPPVSRLRVRRGGERILERVFALRQSMVSSSLAAMIYPKAHAHRILRPDCELRG